MARMAGINVPANHANDSEIRRQKSEDSLLGSAQA
jgi:hypothetical protein